jgi:hypothetical protein
VLNNYESSSYSLLYFIGSTQAAGNRDPAKQQATLDFPQQPRRNLHQFISFMSYYVSFQYAIYYKSTMVRCDFGTRNLSDANFVVPS